MRAELLETAALIWTAFGTYWLLSAVRDPRLSSPSARSESQVYRPLRISLLVVAFLLLFWRRAAIGFLGGRFVPNKLPVALTGFVLFLAGLAVAVWARVHLGQYWSDKVMLQAGHRLVRSGPYAHMRHPIYSGVLLGIAGTALILGEWRGVLSFLLMLTNYSIKAVREESILSAQFGPEFEAHKKQTGFLLPRV
jgi:protein-S-isoprenylcysteine O-methyltransferase Ste14